jgi:hypothetical protein
MRAFVARDDVGIGLRSVGPSSPHKIRQEIGEGGMGMVYLAEQLRPVRRQVALRLIKPGNLKVLELSGLKVSDQTPLIDNAPPIRLPANAPSAGPREFGSGHGRGLGVRQSRRYSGSILPERSSLDERESTLPPVWSVGSLRCT